MATPKVKKPAKRTSKVPSREKFYTVKRGSGTATSRLNAYGESQGTGGG